MTNVNTLRIYITNKEKIMHHNCKDHQQDASKTADKWTNLNAVGEFAASFIDNTYLLGSVFDACSGYEIELLGLSKYGLVFGVAMALVVAMGTSYAHRALNLHLQSLSSANEKTTPLLSVNVDVQPPPTPLSILQYLALIGDGIGHTGEMTSPWLMMFNLATHNHASRPAKILVTCGVTLFGMVTSFASVRACQTAMLAGNVLKFQEVHLCSAEDINLRNEYGGGHGHGVLNDGPINEKHGHTEGCGHAYVEDDGDSAYTRMSNV